MAQDGKPMGDKMGATTEKCFGVSLADKNDCKAGTCTAIKTPNGMGSLAEMKS